MWGRDDKKERRRPLVHHLPFAYLRRHPCLHPCAASLSRTQLIPVTQSTHQSDSVRLLNLALRRDLGVVVVVGSSDDDSWLSLFLLSTTTTNHGEEGVRPSDVLIICIDFIYICGITYVYVSVDVGHMHTHISHGVLDI